MGQPEQRAASGDDLAWLPLGGSGERLTVQRGPYSLVGNDLAATAAVHENP